MDVMMDAPLVYAVVVSWNLRDDTLECLDSLAQVDYPNLRVVLVDNGSTDGTVAAVAARHSDVIVIVSDINLGYAKGCNLGIRRALADGADYVFLLNNDTIVDPAAVTEMVTVMAPEVGIVAPKIYYADDPQRIWSLGGMRHPLTYEKADDPIGALDEGQWEEVAERDYFTGCALLLSRRLLETVGLYDEWFISYYEDSDLAFRAREAGFKLLLAPQAKIWHKVARTSGGSGSPGERYWMGRGSVIFFAKHVRGWRWLIVIPYRTGSAIKTVLRLAWQRRWNSIAAYLRGLRDGLREVWRNRDRLRPADL